VVFDRIDLDRLLEEHKSRNGRPVEKGVHTWAEHKPASTKISKASGGLIRSTKALDFATVFNECLEEAESWLILQLEQLRQKHLFGDSPETDF
jgi:hypothetical protein